MALTLDIVKAVNTIEWSFLIKTLQAFGFSTIFIGWVKVILDSTCLSILVNSSPHGYFRCGRGVRQGDQMSPLLFYIS